jgi:Carboxypeptidase regulatory-like domain
MATKQPIHQLIGMLLSLGLLASAATAAQAGPARLVGQVKDATGKPLQATVQLGAQAVTTDSQGIYELDNLTQGRWQVQVKSEGYAPVTARVWLVEEMTTPLDIALEKAVVPRELTNVGMIGVGALPRTDKLAQRMAGEMVRLGAFPEVGPLTLLQPPLLTPILKKLDRPLYEVLDKDIMDKLAQGKASEQQVREFFSYVGLKALAVARVDFLNQGENQETELKSRSRVELWEFNKDNHLTVRVLAEAGRNEKQDRLLNQDEAELLYQVQVTQMAGEIGKRWEGQNSPWIAYLPKGTTLPTPGSTKEVTGEVVKPK